MNRLFWQIFISFFIIMICILGVGSFGVWKQFKSFHQNQVEIDLRVRANLFSSQAEQLIHQDNSSAIHQLCIQYGDISETRITVIMRDGSIAGDSEKNPWDMENHRDRPEVIEALQGRIGRSTRPSETLKRQMMYVAIPFFKEDSIVAVIRASMAVDDVYKSLEDVYKTLTRWIIVILITAAAVSFLISRQVSKPVADMRAGVEKFARQEFDTLLDTPRNEVLASLATSINAMAIELDSRIKTITAQRSELQLVLSSMAEGVIAMDAQGHLVSINRAGCELLSIDNQKAKGRNIEEITRNVELQSFVNQVLESGQRVEREILFDEGTSKILHAYGRILEERNEGDGVYAILVLNNVTRLKQLENVRKEFVANVSHELKTPITSIKGFVETLLDGAIDRPEDASRFLKIIARHTNRLNAIIEDLLVLSRMEDEAGRATISMQDEKIKEVILSAIETCFAKSKDKNIHVSFDCDETLSAEINAFMVEQALVNLIDNAIKYSNEGSEISVAAEDVNDQIAISVRDSGFGISKEHQSRIFERFYVTDKARSRKLGGTGLGLAIVKHIANAHGGTVTVESVLGRGSLFTVFLKKRQNKA